MAKAKKTTVKIIPDETIIRKIYVLRGQKVMLDYDIAAIYEVETKRLNEQVKRNIERFPDISCSGSLQKNGKICGRKCDASSEVVDLQNTKSMRSQFATASGSKRNAGVTPFAFTEHGVTMLATVLKAKGRLR